MQPSSVCLAEDVNCPTGGGSSMTEDNADGTRQEGSEQDNLGRRGILAWAAMLAGAGLAWLTGMRSAEATHVPGGTPGADSLALHVDSVNNGVQRTFLVSDVTLNPSQVAFNGPGPFSVGVSDAIQGITTKAGAAAGVRGLNMAMSGQALGVSGEAFLNGIGVTGVAGVSVSNLPAGVGVFGQSNADGGIGTQGRIPTGVTANTIGVYGQNLSTNPGAGPGGGGFGCYGFSVAGHGIVGATGTAGGGAVAGSTNGLPGAWAGLFYGPLVVVGGTKSAAVPHDDGAHRLLYCVESPESWFEDFGNASLVRGRAEVQIASDFGAVADMSDYHVFLTPYGNTKGLYVAARTPSGFRVEEHDGGKSEIAFAWRVVAKRKDVTAERLAKVVLPPEPRHPTEPEPLLAEPARVPAPPPLKETHKH
jgi:hypothetical protein